MIESLRVGRYFFSAAKVIMQIIHFKSIAVYFFVMEKVFTIKKIVFVVGTMHNYHQLA
jgi:hypothetical protein